MPASAESPARHAERCYLALRGAIVRGELRPNESLSERRLGEWLAASRTPVREALHRLAEDRLVVNDGRMWVVYEHGVDEIRDIYQLRAGLESQAARLAARWVAHGRELPRDPRAGLASVRTDLEVEELVASNEDFHDAIQELADSPALSEMCRRSRRYYFNRDVARSYDARQIAYSRDQHRRILTAVADGDEDLAGDLAREHVEDAFEVIARFHRGARAAAPSPTDRI